MTKCASSQMVVHVTMSCAILCLHQSLLKYNDLEKANLPNNSFISQTILDDKNALLPDLLPYCNHLINQKVISAIDVYEVLNGLDISKATGPDNIINKLLKEASVTIAEPLSHLLHFSLSLGTFPDPWKLANVIPIFKKGYTMLCTNSLLCCISKVFEKILFDHIYYAVLWLLLNVISIP